MNKLIHVVILSIAILAFSQASMSLKDSLNLAGSDCRPTKRIPERSDCINFERTLQKMRENTIEQVVLRNCSLGPTDVTRVARILADNKSVTFLHLNDNKSGNEGAIAIAKALEVNRFLVNEIGNEGAIAIAEASKVNTALVNNPIGNEWAIAIAKGLEQNRALATARLSWSQIGNEGATAIAKALEVNTILKNLYLQLNQIGNEGVIALGKALEVNRSLLFLDLDRNQFGDDGAAAIGKALEVNRVLSTMILSRNQISEPEQQRLREIWGSRPGRIVL